MTVKVKSISGLEDYASSIQSFAGKFEIAASDTVRQFNTSLKGEKAEAINAFFQKLNEIQKKVFLEAPKDIRIFGQHISTFAESIKGLGFSSFAYTDDDAMSKLQDSLKTPQRNGITIVKDDLVTILDEAIEAMGEGDSNLVNFDLLADTYIATEIFARAGTHTGILIANSVLSDSVNNSVTSFTSLTAQTCKAKAVSSASVTTILEAIKRGDLNADNMNYFDAIYSTDDTKIIEIIISEGSYKNSQELYTNLAKAEIKDASLPVMMIVSRLLEKSSSEGNLKNLDAFFYELSNRNTEDLQLYSSKLSSAMDFIVDGINAQGKSLRPDVPKEYSVGKFKEYMLAEEKSKGRLEELKKTSVRYGQLKSILTYMSVEKFGKQIITIKDVAQENNKIGDLKTTVHRGFRKGSLEFLNGEYLFGVQDMGMNRDTKSETKMVNSKDVMDTLKDLNNIRKLEEQQKYIWLDTAYNTTKDIVSTNKFAGFLWDIMEAAGTTEEEKDVLTEVRKKGLEHVDDITLSKYNDIKNHGRQVISNAFDHYDKSKEIRDELTKIDADILAERFDIGGSFIQEKENLYKNASIDPRYDFEANLWMADLEQNGLRGYNFRFLMEKNDNDLVKVAKNMRVADENMEKIDTSDHYTKKMKSLLTGKGTTNIADLGGEKLYKGLEEFQKTSAKNEFYKFDINDYTKSENTYFNRLVGINSKIGG